MPDVGGIAGDRLRSLCERIERLEDEKASIGSDIKEVYAEAKSNGFNVKIVRLMVRERRMEPTERDEIRELMNLYRAALGMLADTPLGDAATARSLGLAPSAPAPGDVKH